MNVALLVIAKEPVPGLVKTRLCPPCTPAEAAHLAHAALLDTLATVAATPADRRALIFDGDPGAIRPYGFELHPQRGDGLGARLQAAFEDIDGPALLVGMDTPQLQPADLASALARLATHDAVLGPTHDGGYWCVGFRGPVSGAFDGVPMSTSDTCARQLARLHELGLAVGLERRVRDVDTMADARLVAREAPGSHFAQALASLPAANRRRAA